MKWTYTIQTEGLTVEQLLRDEWRLSKKQVHELRMAKGILDADETPIRWNEPLAAGTPVVIQLADTVSPHVPEPNPDVSIVFEDDHLLIACKPKGMPTHPNDPGQSGTLLNGVLGYVHAHGGTYAEHVHRLDQGTSGLVLFAKHPVVKNALDRMLEDRQITREYLAEVEGNIQKNGGTITAPIGRDRHHPTRRHISPSGQPAITHYSVTARRKGTTELRLTLDTGRTHQIRVHLASIGHPITGDELYGGAADSAGTYKLHAFRMTFIHPFTGKKLTAQN
ncbi:RluA family pseudouridine synthase [Planococcus lenghuensis]|uniref:Pseudouridine synthase n=1 Tax=Planococcus lenghuensis TaxID=2213202 RepID=A0A1Q2KXI6_9BACL|nr:RluA family pseudouridine synthase [Planococcus lenghuensis]AQQ52527.1 RNA pseudouridine synthase [Planococcus lenghuensis]